MLRPTLSVWCVPATSRQTTYKSPCTHCSRPSYLSSAFVFLSTFIMLMYMFALLPHCILMWFNTLLPHCILMWCVAIRLQVHFRWSFSRHLHYVTRRLATSLVRDWGWLLWMVLICWWGAVVLTTPNNTLLCCLCIGCAGQFVSDPECCRPVSLSIEACHLMILAFLRWCGEVVMTPRPSIAEQECEATVRAFLGD